LNHGNVVEDGPPSASNVEDGDFVISPMQNSTETLESLFLQQNAADPRKRQRVTLPAAPNRAANELPPNVKRLLKDYMDGDVLRELPPDFRWRTSRALHWTGSGYPIEYKFKATGETIHVDNYLWNSATKRQSIAVASGGCLTEPVIIVPVTKGAIDIWIWKGVDVLDATPCPIERMYGDAEHDRHIKVQYSSRSIVDSSSTTRNISGRPRSQSAVGYDGSPVPEVVNLISDDNEVPIKRKTQDARELVNSTSGADSGVKIKAETHDNLEGARTPLLSLFIVPAAYPQPQSTRPGRSSIGHSGPQQLTTVVFLDAEDNEMRRRILKDCNTISRLFA
jgi:hypothetical protein